MNVWLLVAIVVLTISELAAVVLITLFGPKDQTGSLIAVLIGIVGPIVASLVAVVHAVSASADASAARVQAKDAQQRVDQVQQSIRDSGQEART
jgi:uncharacterized membrane protein YeaQ/YmgE (transglycosylase-associated protein family)